MEIPIIRDRSLDNADRYSAETLDTGDREN